MSLFSILQEEQAREDKARRDWSPLTHTYTGKPCVRCGRYRVYLCKNRETECEKCGKRSGQEND